ncbi:MAG TPA: UbiX family flavin prenyltransferase [Caulobacteraceae bacterium]|jgi:4-hydroxy-3-polyprenylbenzoate decarboxylase|nr:UbiX family flavin prenyltransferase [Caulobacteraceae bacterium]
MARGAAKRLVVGISGASGALLGVRLLEACRDLGLETHLVISRAAALTLLEETGLSPSDLTGRATIAYRPGDLAAVIASGSFPTLGMIIAPCSVRTMSEVATGVTASLLTRAADVTLKERRRLVLLARESPLHLGHLRTMAALTEMGAVIAPPVPAFYARPTNLTEIVDQCVGRALDLFGFDWPKVRRWRSDTAGKSGA